MALVTSDSALSGEADSDGALLGHFATYRLSHAFWSLAAGERARLAAKWLGNVAADSDSAVCYLTQGMQPETDLMVWSTTAASEPNQPGEFFRRRARAESPFRAFVEPVHILWGLTRPSEYNRAARSGQQIDPFASERAPYLIAYPFTKTADWYLLGRDTRQGMMNEHIRVGKQYREITQLLLYSFGVQDQEFVVVYETADLALFSRLVYELRDTEARRYTRADTPLHAGVRVDAGEWCNIVGESDG